MRAIHNIIVHTTGTAQTATPASILNYWRTQLGWRNPGYHILIEANGNIVRLAPDEQVANGVAGHNQDALHVSYIGGIDARGKSVDNRTEAQRYALAAVIAEWKKLYPTARVKGHRDFLIRGVNWKDCPCFDAIPWWAKIETSIKQLAA